MSKLKFLISSTMFFCFLALSVTVFAQTPPSAQSAGGVVRQQADMYRQRKLERKIETEKPSEDLVTEEEVVSPDTGPKVSVKKIVVEGATLLTKAEIRKITSKYEKTELSFTGMQKIADLITDEYRKKGYVTSRAYIPPQTIEKGILIIRIVEGKLGAIDIRGNEYFSTPLLQKKLGIKPDGYFDYSALQKSMVYINQHPDRMAKAILVPGKKPGTTDIVIEVEDNLPFHVGFSYDNWGSRYINANRYAMVLEHNNLTGHDDKLNIKAQYADGAALVLQMARYSVPISRRWEMGAFVFSSNTKQGEEFADLESHGDALIVGVFSKYAFIEKENYDVDLNFGFDSKNITDNLAGVQVSRDELRVLKFGFDVDALDSWGRTVFTAEVDNGLADFMGAMSTKDPDASRVGAGGRFTKGVFNLFRLQPMPFSTSLLLKNSFQYTNNNLVAAEQFQIGGPTSVRGYPPGEFTGDKGFYSSAELSIPLYGLSRDVKVPFREESFYDAFRIVLFWDIGMVNTKTVAAGETETQTLRGAGFGGRLTITQDFEVRVETGYPLGGPSPSDGDTAHTWVEANIKF